MFGRLGGVIGEVGILGLEYLDLHRARLTGGAPRTMPILMIEVTRKCNLRCAYCGYPDFYPDMGEELSTDEIKSVLRECTALKTRIVSFGGGESFLRNDMCELVSCARSLGMHVHIDSNGTRLDSDTMAGIADGSDVAFIFSLDHADPEVNDAVRGHGSHAGVVNSCRLLRATRPGISVGINCVVGSHNIDSLGEMVDLAVSLGINGIKFLPLHYNHAHRWRYGDSGSISLDPADPARVGEALRNATGLARAAGLYTSSPRFVELAGQPASGPRGWDCWAGYLFGNIDPYGNLFPCYELLDTSVNIRNGGLLAAWRSPGMAVLRDRARSCRRACLCSGTTESSLRMNPLEVLRNPVQVVRDFKFFLGGGR